MLALDDLLDLGDELRSADFRITTQQYLFAQQVLVRLAADGRLPNDPARLAAYLGPIFCTSPYEQRRYAEIFPHWLARRFPDRARTAPAPPAEEKRHVTSSTRPGHRIVLAVVALGVAAAFWFGWQNWRPRLLTGVIVADGAVVAGAEIRLGGHQTGSDAAGRFRIQARASHLPASLTVRKAGFEDHHGRVGEFLAGYRRTRLLVTWPGRDVTLPIVELKRPAAPSTASAGATSPPLAGWQRVRWANVLIAMGPALFLVVWTLVRRWRKPVLQRMVSATPKTLRDVYLSGNIRRLLPSLPLRRLAQELRRRRRVHSTEIDVSATVRASIGSGGLFTPVFGSRVEPDYLVLIDRASLSDHQACLADALVGELLRSDVLIQHYDYDGDATLCRPREGVGRFASARAAVSLEELQLRHPEHRVIVFSDGAEFFHPFTGEPAAWVTILTQWSDRVILTPRPLQDWAQREWALERLGFVTLPLSRAGLIALGSSLSDVGAAPLTARRPPTTARSGMDINARRWLERDAPSVEVIDQLCQTLREHLGDRGFAWLAACAVYPQIHWGITLSLVAGLARDTAEVERLLPRLSHLVWLREAYLPDWLREALLARLNIGDGDRVRGLLHELLRQVAAEGDPDARLPIALGTPHTTDSPFRDYIFLHFLSRRRGGTLTPIAPRWLLRVLYRGGSPFLGLRPWVNVAGAALVTAAILAVLPPLHMPEPRLERPPVVPDAAGSGPAQQSPAAPTPGRPRPSIPTGFDAVLPPDFRPILFDFDKSDIRPSERQALDQVARMDAGQP